MDLSVTNQPRMPRPIDHVVMPVGSLTQTRLWLEAMGFLVAPEALHPFGTKNACVFFSDGSYLEPLAVARREDCEAATIAGNVFVGRDAAFRFRRGEPGFSALALRSDDATADLARFHAAGIGEGEVFTFSRDFATADGETRELRFRLGFVRDRRAPDASFFVCEAAHGQAPDRSSLTAHPNGAAGIARVVLSEHNPTDFQYLLQEVIDQREVAAGSFGLTLAAGPADVEVLTPTGLATHYGAQRDERRGLLIEGVVISVDEIGNLGERLRGEGIVTEELHGRLVVRLGVGGQGFIAFERREAA